MVSLIGDLELWLGRGLAPTLAWDYPTIDALSRRLSGEEAPEAEAASADRPPSAEPLAVVGVGCRFPGAHGPDAFWRLIREGGDAIREIAGRPLGRGRSCTTPTPTRRARSASRRGGFLDEVDRFDPRFFNITPREAARMDPQQRLLLETAWETLENAGLPRGTPGRQPHRRLRRHRRRRLRPRVARRRRLPRTHRRLLRHRQRPEHRRQPRLLCPRSQGSESGDRHGLFVVADGPALRGPEPGQPRVRLRPGRRRQPDPVAGSLDRLFQGADAGAGRPLQAVRRRRRRLRPRRGLRPRAAQAAGRRPPRRRRNPGRGARHGRQPGRPDGRHHGAQRPGAAGVHPSGAWPAPASRRNRSTTSRPTAPARRSATPSRCRRFRRCRPAARRRRLPSTWDRSRRTSATWKRRRASPA